MKDIYDILREFKRRRGERFALATLVRTEGSSYRRPGARMLICEDGHTTGSLSGGCLEEEVASRAREVLRTGEPATMSFDTRRRFGCHGKIDVFIERVSQIFLADLTKHRDARRSCLAITSFEGSERLGSRILECLGGEPVAFPRDDNSESVCKHGVVVPSRNSALVQKIHPPIRLLIFGEGPDNAPLQQLCKLLGWQTVAIFDANAFSIEPDDWTAAIVKSHNYGRDFTALQKLLPLNLHYVGLIGPRKRRDQLLNDLLDVGVAINAGFFAPAGIDLAAETPEEIALVVVSEIQRVFAGGSGESLRERKMSIHGPKQTAQSFDSCKSVISAR